MANETRSHFEKRKRSLLKNCIGDMFYDEVYEALRSSKYKTIEEMDEYLSFALKQYDTGIDAIDDFYASQIDEDDSDNS